MDHNKGVHAHFINSVFEMIFLTGHFVLLAPRSSDPMCEEGKEDLIE
jgi:hypothetical protein